MSRAETQLHEEKPREDCGAVQYMDENSCLPPNICDKFETVSPHAESHSAAQAAVQWHNPSSRTPRPSGLTSSSDLSLLSSWDCRHVPAHPANFCVFVETGFRHIAQVGLKLLGSSDPPTQLPMSLQDNLDNIFANIINFYYIRISTFYYIFSSAYDSTLYVHVRTLSSAHLQGLTLLPRLECSGSIIWYHSLDLLDSSDCPTSASRMEFHSVAQAGVRWSNHHPPSLDLWAQAVLLTQPNE
ncbi:UPF0764 protein C16orf89 [Plecturocebus cupreus]